MKSQWMVGVCVGVLSWVAHAGAVGSPIDAATQAKLGLEPGKITVVDFFAEWCASCRKELPLISAVEARSDKQKVAFLGVDTDTSLAVAERFQKELKAHGALSFRVVNDLDQSIVRAFRPRGYPALYFIKDGRVVREILGAQADIDQLIVRELKALGGEQ